MNLPARVKVVEVGPRDGLQNEKETVPQDVKVAFIDALTDAGLPVIEVGAFVRPDRIPQMADSGEVLTRIRRRKGTVYSALVPNRQGYARAAAAKAGEIGVFTAASEAFAAKNINATISE